MGKRRWQLLGRGLLLAGLAGAPGCLSCFHPIEPPCPELLESCRSLPRRGRGHVYIFFVDGIDPTNCANLTGVRDYVQALGFIKTYYGQCFHALWFRSEIRRLHQEDPDARFVLVGFCVGANTVRSLAHSVLADNIFIDLVVYLDGNTLQNVPSNRPENATRVVNILADGCIWNGVQIEGADNHCLKDTGHFGTPSHQLTLETLAQELAQVAALVPVAEPPETAPLPSSETAPTPRPVKPRSSDARDEWDFLKPVTSLSRRAPQLSQRPSAPEGRQHSVLKPAQ